MNRRSGTALVLAFLCLALFAVLGSAHAATPIARISQFKGEVLIVSSEQVLKVTREGQPVNDGDSVQTGNGEAHLTFSDGALMIVRPYTNTVIQEVEEQRGWFLSKTKDWVRRITCQVGNLWFKSGASGKKNYLQSPTAVCGLRGSVSEFGYNNVMTYVREIEGGADLAGPVQRVTEDFFKKLQAEAQNSAVQNPVYNKLNDAYNRTVQAEKTGTALDQAEARVATLEAVKLSIDSILTNPNLTPEARETLNSTLQKVNADLKDALDELSAITGQPKMMETTTPVSTEALTTTTVLWTTTTTTTTLGPTTTTTTLGPTTTTTTTSVTTTTTTSQVSPTSNP